MKKILLIAAIAICLLGCKDSILTTYRVKMEIHYPTRIDTVTVQNSVIDYPRLGSHRGSNYVMGFYETSVPIKILSITEIPDSTKIEE